jgi:replicative DNA helicase Mcm
MTVLTGPEERFQEFLRTFQTEKGEYKYRRRLGQLSGLGERHVVVDFDELMAYDSELAKLLVDKPDEYLPYIERSAWAQLKIEDPGYAELVKKIRVRFRKLPERYSLRRVGEQHLGKMLLLDGIIVRATPVKPLITRAAFQCRKCNSLTYVDQVGFLMRGPGLCGRCRSKLFDFIEKQSTFINSQELRMQERPEDLPPGQLPRALEVKLSEDLVDVARPGDRVSLTGIVRAQQEVLSRRTRLRTFDLFLDANFVDVSGKEAEVVEITAEEEKQILEMAKDPWIHRKLLSSLAPSIYGYENIKEAILYLLFGAVAKTLPDGVTIRGDMNVLLIGDPGTAKSQLLQYVARVAPRGLYTSGRGSTAAGLTAAVVREKSGGLVLEAGALVLADKGVCSIDEIDKMRPDDRVAIHEAMEQQSYHPSVEIMLASGEKRRIGELVDELFAEHQTEKMIGRDCEILPVKRYDITLITTRDFNRFETVPVDRVSRHIAPKHFVQIRYSNGRDVTVTPEHPVFVRRDGELLTVPASEMKAGDFVPGPSVLECQPLAQELVVPLVTHDNEKIVALPSRLTEDLAGIMGYLITEGYSHFGSASEIGFANTAQTFIREMNRLMCDTFRIVPLDYTHVMQTECGVSSRLYRYFETNFPRMLGRVSTKRIPAAVMSSPPSVIRAFLRSAFKGDGSVEPEALCYRTSSKGLAEDYQDLLLRLGISSRLLRDRYNNSFKVYVSRDSLSSFVRQLVDRKDPRYRKIDRLLKRSRRTVRGHDVLPTNVASRLIGFNSMALADLELKRLKAMDKGGIRWLRVTRVRNLPNDGPLRTRWVYDLTVEPAHNFVSQGAIVATLNARASVLAAANPALGRYDAYRNITENINLPVTILSRFDLIFVMRDAPDTELDTRMSEHILTLHRTRTTPEEVPLTPEMFRKYVSYAHRFEPILSEEAAKELRDFYLRMRSTSSTADSPIAITPRQLEALVRLSECRARSFLRNEVTVEDTDAIIRLMTIALQDVGIDTTTGKMDIDTIMTGKPKSLRDRMQSILSTVATLERETGTVLESKLYEELAKTADLSEGEARALVNQLIRDGILYSPKAGHLKRTSA